MTSQRDTLKSLAFTVKEMICDIRDNIANDEKEKDDLLLVEFWFTKLPHLKLINHMIKKVLPFKKQIADSDIHFFYDQRNSIFMGLPQDSVDHLANKFVNGKIDQDHINVIFQYFQAFVQLTEQYQQQK